MDVRGGARRHRGLAALGAIALAAMVAAPVSAGAIELAAHRALYELTLESSRGDITAAAGTMSYDVADACEGWAVTQKLVMNLTSREDREFEMLSDYATYESKDGTQLRFHTRQATDQRVTAEISGEAELDAAGAGTVRYTSPEGQTRKLDRGTLLPMQHTAAIIATAMAGKKFLAVPLFDGTVAEGAQDSTIAVTSWGPPAPGRWPELAKLASGRVHVAFFDQAAGAQQPDYEVSMRYWENGVADDLLMDFGDFVMRGRLKTLVLAKGC